MPYFKPERKWDFMVTKIKLSSLKGNVKSSKKNMAAVCIIGVVILAVIFAVVYNFFIINRYNRLGYINTSGKTIGQIAEENGITLEELLSEYGLPENMRADTEEAAAYYTISVEKIASMSGKTFEELKELYHWDDNITPETSWGVAQGEILLKYMYSSEKALNSFKEEYNLGDDVTGETKYKAVRDAVAMSSPNEKLIGGR